MPQSMEAAVFRGKDRLALLVHFAGRGGNACRYLQGMPATAHDVRQLLDVAAAIGNTRPRFPFGRASFHSFRVLITMGGAGTVRSPEMDFGLPMALCLSVLVNPDFPLVEIDVSPAKPRSSEARRPVKIAVSMIGLQRPSRLAAMALISSRVGMSTPTLIRPFWRFSCRALFFPLRLPRMSRATGARSWASASNEPRLHQHLAHHGGRSAILKQYVLERADGRDAQLVELLCPEKGKTLDLGKFAWLARCLTVAGQALHRPYCHCPCALPTAFNSCKAMPTDGCASARASGPRSTVLNSSAVAMPRQNNFITRRATSSRSSLVGSMPFSLQYASTMAVRMASCSGSTTPL